MITKLLLGKKRRTGLSRNLVHRWIATAAEVVTSKYIRIKMFDKLATFSGGLKQALDIDANRSKKDQRTSKARFFQIKASRYLNGYICVINFI